MIQHWNRYWSAYTWAACCAVAMWWAVTHP
jgi:hypothetical protein